MITVHVAVVTCYFPLGQVKLFSFIDTSFYEVSQIDIDRSNVSVCNCNKARMNPPNFI